MSDESALNKSIGETLPVLLKNKVKQIPNYTLQASKNKSGMFVRYSYIQVYQHVIELAYSLKRIGVKKGDNVGIMSDNRREWLVTDFALLSLGAVDVPRGCDSMGVEMRFILSFAECKVCFFENSRQLGKVIEKNDEVPLLKSAVLFDYTEDDVVQKARNCGITVINYSYLEAEGASVTKEEWEEIETDMDKISKDDVATIIFTSGTTGDPKGVQLTHDNMIAQCEVAPEVLGLMKSGDLWLSVLPIWHSFERSFLYIVIALNGGFAYSKPIASLMLSDMSLIQPQWMNCVPRLWESIAQGLYREIRKMPSMKRRLVNRFIFIGKLYFKAKQMVCGLKCRYSWYPRVLDVLIGIVPFCVLWPMHRIGEALVYKELRGRFGGKMRAAISGGGALQSDTEEFYHAIGFNLLEAYGMTETAPVVSVRNSKHPRTNNVGVVLSDFEVKVVAEKDGQIADATPLPPGHKGIVLLKGRQIMKGYYKRPDLTAKVIDSDGFLNSGDIGMLSCDNELKIVGRAKDTIVLLGGENIEPQVIEKAVNASAYIERCVVVGQDKKALGALIVPDQNNVLSYADENNIVYDNYEALLLTDEIVNLFRSEIDSLVNAKTGFRTCERISKFVLLHSSFEIGKEINAKQELMRHKIVSLYKKQYDSLFI